MPTRMLGPFRAVLRLAAPIALIAVVDWLLDVWGIGFLDETAPPVGTFHAVAWLVAAVVSGFGVTHALAYAVAVNRAVVRDLRLSAIVFFTALFSAVSLIPMFGMRYLIDMATFPHTTGSQWATLAFYPAASLLGALTKYAWIRRRQAAGPGSGVYRVDRAHLPPAPQIRKTWRAHPHRFRDRHDTHAGKIRMNPTQH